jgi:Glycerophosphoryl diester phosphodiesterase
MDVRPLKDGTLVVCHDATVDRIAVGGVTGRVDQMTVAQWSKLLVRNTGGTTSGPAAFLSDVLTEFGTTSTVLMIELKDYTDDARNEYVRQLWPYRDQIIGACFNQTVNRVIAGSGFHGQHLANSPPATYPDRMNCVALGYTTITPAVVAAVHAKNQRLWAWTVNDAATKDRLVAMGVDGIITDDPTI